MSPCREFRPLVSRVAEGEATPDEALAVARHLPDCTACRIRLSRDARLANVLESLGDCLPVGETFLRNVMRALPTAPPPFAAGAARRRRGLKLAGLAGVAVLGGALMARVLTRSFRNGPEISLPRLGLPLDDDLLRTFGVVLEAVGWALERVVAPTRLPVPWEARFCTSTILPTLAAVAVVAAGTAIGMRFLRRGAPESID